MRSSWAVLYLLCVLAAACGGSTTPAGPSNVLPAADTITFNLTGSVRDSLDNATLSDVMVQVASGPDVEKFVMTDASGNYSLTRLRVGAFVVRYTRVGYESLDRTVSALLDTRLDVTLKRGPACDRLAAPTDFRVDVAGSTVTYRWNAVASADDYLLGVGSSSGSSRTRSTNTTQTSYVWRGMSPGTYFARVAARNACFRSNNSNEVQFTVGS
jgi:hypothetical protein